MIDFFSSVLEGYNNYFDNDGKSSFYNDTYFIEYKWIVDNWYVSIQRKRDKATIANELCSTLELRDKQIEKYKENYKILIKDFENAESYKYPVKIKLDNKYYIKYKSVKPLFGWEVSIMDKNHLTVIQNIGASIESRDKIIDEYKKNYKLITKEYEERNKGPMIIELRR